MQQLLALLLVVTACIFTTHACTGPHLDASLERWSEAATWSGTLPVAGDTVNIPAGKKVLFDLADSPVFFMVNISGTLVFDEQPTKVELNSQNVFIQNGGLLQIGSDCCFYNGKAFITLHHPGDTTFNPYAVGTKVLGVLAGGSLELFGRVPDPTWTNLDQQANKGDSVITLADNVEGWWHVNDTIVIATTDFDKTQNEVRTIVGISGSTLTLDAPLEYTHNAAVVQYVVDERAEVAVLTRNIVVRGENGSSETTQFGGHIMGLKNLDHMFIQGVEIYHAGQRNIKGRYPIHFHMCGDLLDRAYVKDCSIHDNYQRSITIHGSHHVIIRRNVAYNTVGHSFFIEDGIETGNELSWNLGIRSVAIDKDEVTFDGTTGFVSGGLLLSDPEPAIFWITNPNNTIQNNVAVGAKFGFWCAFPVNPHGPSATPTIFPIYTRLGVFAYNKAHSMDSDGLFVDRGPDEFSNPNGGGYIPWSTPSNRSAGEPVEAVFSTFTAYKCRNRGTWIRGGLVTVELSAYADNAIGATFAINSQVGLLRDSVFIGETDNYGNPRPWEQKGLYNRSLPLPWDPTYPIRGWEFYDGPVSIYNSRFFNYATVDIPAGNRKASAISMLRKDQFSIAPTNDAKYIGVMNSNDLPVHYADYLHDGDKASNFVDLDGSVTGRPPNGNQRAAVVNKNPALATSSCDTSYLSTWNAYVCPAHFSYLGIKYEGAVMPNPQGQIDAWNYLYREDQVDTAYPVCGGLCPPENKSDTSMFATVIRNKGYTMHFNTASVLNGFLPNKLNLYFLYTDKFNYDGSLNSLIIGVCYPAGTTITALKYNGYSGVLTNNQPAANRDALTDAQEPSGGWSTTGNGLWTRQDNDGYIWFKMIPSEERDSTNMRDAWPAGVIELTVNIPTGVTPSCPRRARVFPADPGLPPQGSVGSFPALGQPTYAFVGRIQTEACQSAFQDSDSAASSLSSLAQLALFILSIFVVVVIELL